MEIPNKYIVSEKDKQKYICTLTENLLLLRTKAEISQEDLANIIGISRQTYGVIERKSRPMSWNTYLSLILFFDNNNNTHKMLRDMKIFPEELFRQFNDNTILEAKTEDLFSEQITDIISQLDEQAISTIKTVMMLEFSRCKNIPGENIVKFFDGVSLFSDNNRETNKKTTQALKNIRKKQNEK